MKRNFYILFLLAVLITLPNFVGAAVDSIQSLSIAVAGVVWKVFTVIALVMFVIAGILFLTAAGDPDKIKTARKAFLWGIVGVVVGIVAFSIIKITCNALGMAC